MRTSIDQRIARDAGFALQLHEGVVGTPGRLPPDPLPQVVTQGFQCQGQGEYLGDALDRERFAGIAHLVQPAIERCHRHAETFDRHFGQARNIVRYPALTEQRAHFPGDPIKDRREILVRQRSGLGVAKIHAPMLAHGACTGELPATHPGANTSAGHVMTTQRTTRPMELNGRMPRDLPKRVADLRAYNRLAVDATVDVANLVEHMHHAILTLPLTPGMPLVATVRDITRLVYRSIHGIARTTGTGIDSALALDAPDDVRPPQSVTRDAPLAAVNGVIGDHLHATDNPLQITMPLRHDGTPLELSADGIARAIPGAGGRILVLAHGLCVSDRQWQRNGHDHGAALAADAGFTPVYLHYNSGLHLASNGLAFAQQLEALVRA